MQWEEIFQGHVYLRRQYELTLLSTLTCTKGLPKGMGGVFINIIIFVVLIYSKSSGVQRIVLFKT